MRQNMQHILFIIGHVHCGMGSDSFCFRTVAHRGSSCTSTCFLMMVVVMRNTLAVVVVLFVQVCFLHCMLSPRTSARTSMQYRADAL
jgi:hypothetical protein